MTKLGESRSDPEVLRIRRVMGNQFRKTVVNAQGIPHSLDELNDVDLTGAADGDVIQRVGGVWVAAPPPSGTSIDPVDLLEQLKALPHVLAWHYADFNSVSEMTQRLSGTGAAVIEVGNATGDDTVGVVQMTPGTTATGYAEIIGGASVLGTAEWFYECRSELGTLSDTGNEYWAEMGMYQTQSALTSQLGVYFLYDRAGTRGVASTFWQCVTLDGSGSTKTTTSVAAALAKWNRFTIEVNAAATSVVFKINGVTVATHTTNILTSPAIYPKASIQKTVGVNLRHLYVDYINVTSLFATERINTP